MYIISDYKLIHDSIHGYIPISNILCHIIDSKQFQRLRKLKQLGACCYIYPNAVHTRFEHSIGTCHIANKILESIVRTTNINDMDNYLSQIPELKDYLDKTYTSQNKLRCLDNYIIEMIKIGALCHDLGHGPFSHLFDDFFLPCVKKENHILDSHEERSCSLVEIIIKENKFLNKIISDDMIKFIKSIINPSSSHTGFIYMIVSNYMNGLDVDKYDYIVRDSYVTGLQTKFNFERLVNHIRVIDNIICYQEQAVNDIIELYETRYQLHKNVYSHKGVISAQFMIIEIFKHIDKFIGLSDSIKDMKKFILMTDEYILTCYNMIKPSNKTDVTTLSKINNIIEKLDSHKLYSHVLTHVSNVKINITKKDFKIPSDILIYSNTIGYISGNKSNPLNNIYVFNTKIKENDIITKRKININENRLLLSNIIQEHLTMIFYKKKKNIVVNNMIKNIFKDYIANNNKINENNEEKILDIFN